MVNAGFEKRFGTPVSYAHMIDSVIATKAMAQCGNPPFTVPAILNAEAVLLAEGGCLQDYDLGVVTNYKDLLPGTFEPPRAGLKSYWAAHTQIVMGLVYNTKRVTAKPTSFLDLGSAKYKGKIAIPAYGWVGIQWLHALNQSLGGTPDNIDPGMKAIAELVKKNDALVMENTDVTLKAFTREEIWMMPFWNGRCFSLQADGVPVDIVFPQGQPPGRQRVPDPQGHQVRAAGTAVRQHHPGCRVPDRDDAAVPVSAVQHEGEAPAGDGPLCLEGGRPQGHDAAGLSEVEPAPRGLSRPLEQGGSGLGRWPAPRSSSRSGG